MEPNWIDEPIDGPLDVPPIQRSFDEAALRNFTVKRHRLRTSWPKVVHPPTGPGSDWRIRLPFEETYMNAFLCMVDWEVYPFVNEEGTVTLYLQRTAGDDDAPQSVYEWVETVGEYVAMKDFLALSFALDYEREDGDPQKPQTRIGQLRYRAKPYSGQDPTPDTWEAVEKLVDECMGFLERMTCYSSASCVVGVPPSTPRKPFHLAHQLAQRIADRWDRWDCSSSVRTVRPRSQLKNVPVEAKLDQLISTIEVDEEAFEGTTVLLIDDLYQSGTTMNYCALLLLRAGARRIFGLALEKTCSNTDNL